MKYEIRISKGKIIGLIIVAIFIGILAYNSGYNPNYDYKSINTAPKEYWDLFRDCVKKKFKLLQTITFKDQSPISEFIFDDNKYFIEVFKLDVSDKLPLNKLVNFSNNSGLMINGVTYLNLGSPAMRLNYKLGKNKLTSIQLNLYGEPVNTLIRNDTVAYFASNFKIFSIYYNNSDTTSIWSMTEGEHPHIPDFTLPINIMFLKKNANIYFLLMSVNDRGTPLNTMELYKILK